MSTEQSHTLAPVETKDGSFTLRSERFGATYHALQGAMEESRYVFLNNGLLPFMARHPKASYRILEIGFGTGLNAFLSFLEAKRSAIEIHYHAVELYPVPPEIARQLNFVRGYSEEEGTVFLRMHEQPWDKEEKLYEAFYLSKHLVKTETFHSDLKFDIIYFDAFSPKDQPELWTEQIFQNMFSLLNEKGMLVTYCAQGQMKRNLKAAGFSVKALKGFATKREMTVAYRY